MTQEDKEFLLKDLCARLPYKIICKWKSDGFSGGGILRHIEYVEGFDNFKYWDCYFEDENDDIPIEIVKPYLRPMSSMTDVEKQIYEILLKGFALNHAITLIDWLNSHYFDYRGLIEKGLALEAPEGMYNIKE